MDEFDEFSLITKLNRQELTHILVTIRGTKELVVESSLLRPLDKLCSMSTLKSLDCQRVQQLNMDGAAAWGDQIEHRVFLVRPTIAVSRKICELIRASPNNPYSVIVVGSKKTYFDRELEKEGLFGTVDFYELNLTLIHIESDLFSLELPQYPPDIFDRYYQPIAKALWQLQVLYGQIHTTFGIGSCFPDIEKELKRIALEFGEPSATADQPISHVFLFDRRLDIPSVLLTSLTYESILNDVFQYSCGKITLEEAVFSKGQQKDAELNGRKNPASRVFALNNTDPIFSAIRNSHMTSVFPFLSARAKMLQSHLERASTIQQINEMKNFVSTELKNFKEQQKQLEIHISACEHVLLKMRGSNERFTVEQSVIRGEFEDSEVLTLVLKLIAVKCNMWTVLQLCSLWSLRSNGLPTKFYQQLQEAFLHRYGFEQLATFYKLRQHGLLVDSGKSFNGITGLPFHILGRDGKSDPAQHRKKGSLPQISSSLLQSAPTFCQLMQGNSKTTSPPPLSIVINAFQLCPAPTDNDRSGEKSSPFRRFTTSSRRSASPTASEPSSSTCGEQTRKGLGYMFSDAYIPLVSHVVEKTVVHGWNETRLKRVFDEQTIFCTNPTAKGPDNRIRRAILVCFVGGITYAEVASLRQFAQDHNFRIIMLATHIINRAQFIRSYTEFLF